MKILCIIWNLHDDVGIDLLGIISKLVSKNLIIIH